MAGINTRMLHAYPGDSGKGGNKGREQEKCPMIDLG